MIEPREFVIDLFCGAGGTSAGVHLANCNSKVTACVNHDEKAIESHRINHPYAKHFIEDIRNPEVVFFLKLRVDALRKLYPGCIITIWASLECTNFSKAKGGLPREADSRTLANHLFMYLDALQPDYLMIENVVEFMSWGPLDEKGKPVSRKRGQDYLKWIEKVKSRGYRFDWKELNSADYGAYTSRTRYFAQFAKNNLPISWPEKTHTKNPSKEKGLFDNPLKKWKPVKEVLQLENEGKSIFTRKKPLVENTLKRIYAGLVKFVANGDDSFIKKYYSGRPAGKVISVDGPAGTITTIDGQSIVTCDWMLKYNSKNKNGKHIPPSIENPSPTVSTQGRLGIVKAEFLQRYYSGNDKNRNHSLEDPAGVVRTNNCMALVNANFIVQRNSGNPKSKVIDTKGPARTITGTGGNQDLVSTEFLQSYYGNGQPHNSEEPCPTVTTKDRFAKVKYLMMNYGNGNNRDIKNPAATIVNNDKHNLVSVQPWLFNPQYSNKGNSVEVPSPTVIARQDKKPLSLIICEKGSGYVIPVYDDDNETMVKIKMFMAYFGILDIKMRMLLIPELLRIQGFPEGYELDGNQTEQKKFIGNSVEVTTAKALFEAHHNVLVEHFEAVAA